jgi:hypothetical protein
VPASPAAPGHWHLAMSPGPMGSVRRRPPDRRVVYQKASQATWCRSRRRS